MKRVIAVALAIMVFFTSSVELLAAELARTENPIPVELETQLVTGLQETETEALAVEEATEEIIDYRDILEKETYSEIYNNEWDRYGTNYIYNQLSDELKGLWDALDVMCLSYMTSTMDVDINTGRMESISLPYVMTRDELKQFWQLFLYSSPQYYFVLNSYSYYFQAGDQNQATAICLKVYDDFCDGDDRAKATAEVKTKIQEWENIANTYETDAEKVKVVFDLICNEVDYNYDFVNGWVTEQDAFSQSAYSVFCGELTVCAGYADAMAIMCNGLGIDAISVTSSDHQWNKIRIEDSWYNYDATWGDQDDGIYYLYYARSDAFYDSANQASSHAEEAYWLPYLPACTLDAPPANAWYAPGTYPQITETTCAPVISMEEKNDLIYVTITCDTPGATIYYTLDGRDPGIASVKSYKYKGEFVLDSLYTIKAIAVCDTYYDSEIVAQSTELNRYTITYELNGGINDERNPHYYSIDAKAFTLYPATRDGYIFKGWYSDAEFTQKIEKISGTTGNITVYAKWEKSAYMYQEILNDDIENNIRIIYYDGNEAEVVIPDTIDGYVVTQIGSMAFYGHPEITSVVIPDTVTEIAYAAFRDCSSLENLQMSQNVVYIDDYAFAYAEELKSIDMPASLEWIGTDVFLGCKDLTIYCYRNSIAQEYAIENNISYIEKKVSATSIKLNKTKTTLKQFDKLQLNATLGPDNTTDSVTWSSSDSTIASVDKKGLVTIYDKLGTVVITALTNSGKKATCEIKVVKKTYKIEYVLNGGKNNSANPSEYDMFTEKIVLKSATRTGYTFKGWYSDSKYNTKVTEIEEGSSGDIKLYAKWEKKKYTITYVLNGGKNNSSNPEYYYVTSATILLENPTYKGYTFKGWYSDSQYKSRVKEIAKGSTGSIKLYARWEANSYTIKFDGNGATSGSMSSVTDRKYDKGYTLKENAFKRKGYTFTGWNTKKDGSGDSYKNKSVVKNLTSTNNKTVTLYAQWKKYKYTITYYLNGGKNSSSNPDYYYITSDTIKLKNPTRTGYTFKGWYSDSKYKTPVKEIKTGSSGTKKLYAKWEANKYNIKFNGNGATSGTMSSTTSRKYGQEYTLKANVYKRKGYTFTGWNTKKDGSGKMYKNKAVIKNLTSTNDETVTLYAQWKKNK